MFEILIILSSIIVGIFVFHLIAFLFGDKPLVRLLKLLMGIIAGVGYFLLCAAINVSEDFSIFLGLLIFLGPVGAVAIIWIKDYMYKNK